MSKRFRKMFVMLALCAAMTMTAAYATGLNVGFDIGAGAEMLTVADATSVIVPGEAGLHAGIALDKFRIYATGRLGTAFEVNHFHRFAQLGIVSHWQAGAGFGYDAGYSKFDFTINTDFGIRGVEYSSHGISDKAVSLYMTVAPGFMFGDGNPDPDMNRYGRMTFPITVTYGKTSTSVSAGVAISVTLDTQKRPRANGGAK